MSLGVWLHTETSNSSERPLLRCRVAVGPSARDGCSDANENETRAVPLLSRVGASAAELAATRLSVTCKCPQIRLVRLPFKATRAHGPGPHHSVQFEKCIYNAQASCRLRSVVVFGCSFGWRRHTISRRLAYDWSGPVNEYIHRHLASLSAWHSFRKGRQTNSPLFSVISSKRYTNDG